MVGETESGDLAARPPYRVPSMAEIAALAPNGYRVVSTFSGCGGSCLGFRMAGFRVVWASEFVPAARETYAANHDTPVDARDIRTVSPADILAATGLKVGELDVLEGSPPCASFSTAGRRERGWGQVKAYSDREQRTDDLFFEFVRIVDGLAPRVFVAENVSGLIKGTAKGYFKRILAALRATGYHVEARLLDAQWLGVPQARQRIIFVGVRQDLKVPPAFPRPFPYRYSMRDALPWLSAVGTKRGAIAASEPAPTIQTHGRLHTQSELSAIDDGRFEGIALDRYRPGGAPSRERFIDADQPAPAVSASGIGTGFRGQARVVHVAGSSRGTEHSVDAPAPTVMANGLGNNKHSSVLLETPALGAAVGREWDKLRVGGQSEKYYQLVRPDPDDPCPTVTAAGGNVGLASVTHPYERRKFTIEELRALCSFPSDFVLTGTFAQQWERLGRSVPPLMMRAIAETLRDRVLAVIDGTASL